MRDLTADEMAVMDRIIESPCSFVKLDDLREFGTSLTAMVAEELVEIWSVTGVQRVTLTPLGAEVMGVTLVERVETLPKEYTTRGGRSEEYPCSDQSSRWDHRDPRTGRGIHEPRFTILPRHHHRVSDGILAFLPAPDPTPAFLLQPNGQPIKVFAGGNGGGYPIPIDYRMAHRRFRKPVKNGKSRHKLGPNLDHSQQSTATNTLKASEITNGQNTVPKNGQDIAPNSVRYRPDYEDGD